MTRYDILFSGQLVPGALDVQVRANLARLFQADARRIDALFDGRATVIKQGLDAESAERYRATLERAGAQVELRPVPDDVEVEKIEMTAVPAEPEASSGRLQVRPRDEYMAAFAHVDAPDFGLAPTGSDLAPVAAAVPAPPLDLSALSLAPPGADMDTRPAPSAPRAPDTSHLALER